jgi:hypothetical protein
MTQNQGPVSGGDRAKHVDGTEALLNERQAARVLGVSPRTLWGLANRGEVPFVRVGKTSKRYAPSDLRAYCDRNRVGGTVADPARREPAEAYSTHGNHGGHHG